MNNNELSARGGSAVGGKIQSNCPFCGLEYDLRSLHVLEERGNGFLGHIKCLKCQGGVITFVSFNPLGGLMVMGVATDLSENEVLQFEKGEAVSDDDAVEMHSLLTNDGELFSNMN